MGHDREHVEGREGGSGRREAAEVQREAAQAAADEVAELRCRGSHSHRRHERPGATSSPSALPASVLPEFRKT